MSAFFRVFAAFGLMLLPILPVGATIAPKPAETVADVLTRAVQVSTGWFHTCAVTSEATLKCWGDNYWGQLGNGTTTSSLVPVDVTGLTGIKSVSVGERHTCALTLSGGVKCWGVNWQGQLGVGYSTNASAIPMDVPGLESNVSAISAGRQFNTALMTSDGSVKYWGMQFSDSFQLYIHWTPEYAVELKNGHWISMTNIIAISSGQSHACGVTNQGSVKCWGGGEHGQIGNGYTMTDYTAWPVVGITNAIGISAGGLHSCALLADGSAKCWGANGGGQLGDGTYQDRLTPVPVSNLSGVRSLSAGGAHTCAVLLDSKVKCWGSNVYGQYGDGTQASNPIPVPASDLRGSISSTSAGNQQTCAVFMDGGLRCWGKNNTGQIGNGTKIPINSFVAVDAVGLISNTTQISSLWFHTCAVTAESSVKCWGNNDYGQIGDGTTLERHIPINVVGLDNSVQSVATGWNSTCALTIAGGVKCWGANDKRQLGDGTTVEKHYPVNVMGLTSGVIAITAGSEHYCALTTSHGVKCWGANQYRQLGLGWPSPSNYPSDVEGLTSGVASIAAGWQHSCVRMETGGVKCWGGGESGELGIGTDFSSSLPVDTIGLPTVVNSLSAGEHHTCAIANGQPFCWGENHYGELGNGTITDILTPTLVGGVGQDVVAISSSLQNMCMALANGIVKCSGSNWAGQLGDGTLIESHTLLTSTALSANAVDVVVGINHVCALTDLGGIKCWGGDYDGELGDGVLTQATPVCVTDFVCNALFYQYLPSTFRNSSLTW